MDNHPFANDSQISVLPRLTRPHLCGLFVAAIGATLGLRHMSEGVAARCRKKSAPCSPQGPVLFETLQTRVLLPAPALARRGVRRVCPRAIAPNRRPPSCLPTPDETMARRCNVAV
jgi:hypothetical protein